jgi:hypothetical protein
MSKTLEKRAVAAETIANTRLEAEADAIFRKYCFDSHRIATEASKQEQEIIWRWGTPHLKETFENFMNVFFSPLMSDFFEREIYPKTLIYENIPGNEGLILGLDNLFIKTVYPDLWHRFIQAETAIMKKYETDPDYEDTGIGQELADEFKKASEKLETVKVKARDRVRKYLAQLSE